MSMYISDNTFLAVWLLINPQKQLPKLSMRVGEYILVYINSIRLQGKKKEMTALCVLAYPYPTPPPLWSHVLLVQQMVTLRLHLLPKVIRNVNKQ